MYVQTSHVCVCVGGGGGGELDALVCVRGQVREGSTEF